MFEPQSGVSTQTGIRSVARVVFAAASTLLVIFALSTTLSAQTSGFEIVIPVDTVVRDVGVGSETLLSTTPVPQDLVGAECTVTATSENQSSVHPGNDLVVTGSTSVLLEDVEAVPGGTVEGSADIVLGTSITITLVMGQDDVFSAGIDVTISCDEPPTSTTDDTSSTGSDTTDGSSSSTDGTDGSSSSTDSTDGSSSSTDTTKGGNGGNGDDDDDDDSDSSSNPTSSDSSTTTSGGDENGEETVSGSTLAESSDSTTDSSVADEVSDTELLPFTGSSSAALAGLAVSLSVLGVLFLLGTASRNES